MYKKWKHKETNYKKKTQRRTGRRTHKNFQPRKKRRQTDNNYIVEGKMRKAINKHQNKGGRLPARDHALPSCSIHPVGRPAQRLPWTSPQNQGVNVKKLVSEASEANRGKPFTTFHGSKKSMYSFGQRYLKERMVFSTKIDPKIDLKIIFSTNKIKFESFQVNTLILIQYFLLPKFLPQFS